MQGRQTQLEVVLKADQEQLDNAKVRQHDGRFDHGLDLRGAEVDPVAGDANNDLNAKHDADDDLGDDVECDDEVVPAVVQFDQLLGPAHHDQQQSHQVDEHDHQS